MRTVPFNRPYKSGRELEQISQAIASGHVCGDGQFSKACSDWLESFTGCTKALLTHSCTAALEMSALLADVEPGDEVIMPSFTFVSTSNAFVLRGATPVFVDIRRDTLNLDESLVEAACTSKTKAIVPVHYAGVGCEMDELNRIAKERNLMIIEDAAQALGATYKGKQLGSFGALATLSFHETKNINSGEGGALLINDEKLIDRATMIREKGTNRSLFLKGVVDKYTWVDVGSSYLPSEILAAYLMPQLEDCNSVNESRGRVWRQYHDAFLPLETSGQVTRPSIPDHCQQNHHIYHLRVRTEAIRDSVMATLRRQGIGAVFHYIPLHSAPAGRKFGRVSGNLLVTNDIATTLIRLPLWAGMTAADVSYVIDAVNAAIRSHV